MLKVPSLKIKDCLELQRGQVGIKKNSKKELLKTMEESLVFH